MTINIAETITPQKINKVLAPSVESWTRFTTETGTTWSTSYDAYRVTITFMKSASDYITPKKDRMFIVVTRGMEVCDVFSTWETQTFDDARQTGRAMVEIALRRALALGLPYTASV